MCQFFNQKKLRVLFDFELAVRLRKSNLIGI